MTEPNKLPKVSIIIPAKDDNEYLRECISKCLEVDYPDFEIIVLPDNDVKLDSSGKVKIIPTGITNPSAKRDKGISKSQGEILAFIDDDAYPGGDWLKQAVKYFNNPDVAAVGGPGITPSSDNISKQASGIVYSSKIVSDGVTYRYVQERQRYVDDYPTCNFIVRKDIVLEIGGFKVKYWPGEDTYFCLELTSRLKKKIIYSPDVLIYHHRRDLFKPHLKQISRYGLHRGYFAKHYPKTSCRLSYFIPSIFVLWLVLGSFFSIFNSNFSILFLISILSYLTAVFISSLNNLPKLTLLVFSGIILTHITYGLNFIKGLIIKRLTEE